MYPQILLAANDEITCCIAAQNFRSPSVWGQWSRSRKKMSLYEQFSVWSVFAWQQVRA